MPYEPTRASLSAHPLPDWFNDAKFGIFVHWYPSAVVGWAPLSGELTTIVKEHGFRYWLKHNPTPNGTPTACASPAAQPRNTARPMA